MVRAIILFVSIFGVMPTYALTQVTASIDKNPVTVKESIVLTIVADDDIDSNALDTSALLGDFIVGRTSVSTQTSMVNFQTSRTTKWTTLLIPRREGNLTIPALKIEDQQSAPIQVNVVPLADSSVSRQQDLFITAEVSNKDIYVQQMMTLTVKLHFAAELQRGSLSEPSLTGATITQIGKDKENETIINGRRFRVIERTYSVTPQQSGDFVLASPMFSGEIMVQSARRSNFLSFGETKPVSVIGEEIPITVRPIPQQFQGQWLPSELLTMHEEWQPTEGQFTVGEPITRTITLTAAGVSSEQLPAIALTLPKGLKVYPDQAELHSSLNKGRIISQSVRNFAIVASRAGEYTLPALNIPWWNTVTNLMESATLPAQTITVKPNENMDTITPATSQTAQGEASQRAPETLIIEKSPWLQWLFLALWILTCIAWITQYFWSRREKANLTNDNDGHQVNDVHLAMLAACKKNNGAQVMNLLLPWTKSIGKTQAFNNISDAKVYFNDDAFSQAVDDLYACFYGNNVQSTTPWQGNQLLQALSTIYKTQLKQSDNTSIRLNP